MRRGLIAIPILTLVLAITGCGTPAPYILDGEYPVRLIFATDLHFYAPDMVGDFELFTQELERGDGKVAQYSHEIVSTLIDTVLTERPDALLLGGDLTLNGEYESHRQLAEMLKPVHDAGIPVLVVPGNHDINNLGAFNYKESDSCASIDEHGFRELYAPLGMDSAISRDEESLSYLYALRNDVRLLMMDSCDYDGFGRSTGSISEKTVKWAEKQLKAARKAKAEVVSVTHHNLLKHSPRFDEPYILHDNKSFSDLLKRYNVKLNLTGHIHIQHILQAEEANGLSEAVTGAMLVSPHYYAALEIGADKNVSYEVKSLDVSAWAKKNGSTNEDLLNFESFSRDFFDRTNSRRHVERLTTQDIPAEKLEEVVDFAKLVNRHYYSGTVAEASDEIMRHPAYGNPWYTGAGLNEMETVHTRILLQ